MATYVNDLRLKEIATGDESGTWGASTNTNLELIGDAFGYGTEAITTNADTHTTTIADGSADAGRAMFLKYTGTLDSACTITIGPNTVSKLWFIENGTSGSQNIIISQGSGANVTIPNGQVKVIYSDGAGSGAAMVDAFASLALTLATAAQPNITSLGTLTTLTVDDITINGSTISDGADLTLDAEGDIILDANGGDIRVKDAGTAVAVFENDSLDFKIVNSTQDKDIIFRGNDGGSGIDALTLDMSDAGTAIFNHDVKLHDNGEVRFGAGAGDDLKIYHNGTNSYIDNSTGDLYLRTVNNFRVTDTSNNKMILCQDGGETQLYHNGSEKLNTTVAGVNVTGKATGTLTTANGGSFDMNLSNNFKCTPSGNFTLTFTNISAQSGNILLINSGGHTISAHANTKVDANILGTISTAGTYLLAYFSDGTNAYMTNSAAYS